VYGSSGTRNPNNSRTRSYASTIVFLMAVMYGALLKPRTTSLIGIPMYGPVFENK